jgi:hypothetical protein
MTRRIILCALLILFAIGDIANGKVRKSTKKKTQHTTVVANQQERYDEIDNYDFLYAGANDDLNLDYDVATINCPKRTRHVLISPQELCSLALVDRFFTFGFFTLVDSIARTGAGLA